MFEFEITRFDCYKLNHCCVICVKYDIYLSCMIFICKIEKLKRERELALEQRGRLCRMKKDRDEFQNMLRGKRKEQFKVHI